MKKIFNAIVDILIVVILVFSLVVLSLSLTSKKNGVPSFLGYTIFTVQTDSMEPTINVGDLMISKVTDSSYSFNEGDVVTFIAYSEDTSYLNTHRIVHVEEVDHIRYYTTKGDNALGEDNQKMVAGDIVAIWHGFKIAKAGQVIDYLKSKSGFFLCIMLPMILFFIYTMYKFIVNLIEYNKAKAIEAAETASADLMEKQKEEIIREYLAKQKAEKEEEDETIQT